MSSWWVGLDRSKLAVGVELNHNRMRLSPFARITPTQADRDMRLCPWPSIKHDHPAKLDWREGDEL